MQVDFNHLRKELANAYNYLIDKINEEDGLIYREDIKENIEYLGECIGSILCTYAEGNSNFKNLSDVELKP